MGILHKAFFPAYTAQLPLRDVVFVLSCFWTKLPVLVQKKGVLYFTGIKREISRLMTGGHFVHKKKKIFLTKWAKF